MRTVLFWSFTQGVVVIPFATFRDIISGPIFKGQESKKDPWPQEAVPTLEDGTYRLPRNVGMKLVLHAA